MKIVTYTIDSIYRGGGRRGNLEVRTHGGEGYLQNLRNVQKCTRVEGGPKSINIECTYFLDGTYVDCYKFTNLQL